MGSSWTHFPVTAGSKIVGAAPTGGGVPPNYTVGDYSANHTHESAISELFVAIDERYHVLKSLWHTRPDVDSWLAIRAVMADTGLIGTKILLDFVNAAADAIEAMAEGFINYDADPKVFYTWASLQTAAGVSWSDATAGEKISISHFNNLYAMLQKMDLFCFGFGADVEVKPNTGAYYIAYKAGSGVSYAAAYADAAAKGWSLETGSKVGIYGKIIAGTHYVYIRRTGNYNFSNFDEVTHYEAEKVEMYWYSPGTQHEVGTAFGANADIDVYYMDEIPAQSDLEDPTTNGTLVAENKSFTPSGSPQSTLWNLDKTGDYKDAFTLTRNYGADSANSYIIKGDESAWDSWPGANYLTSEWKDYDPTLLNIIVTLNWELRSNTEE